MTRLNYNVRKLFNELRALHITEEDIRLNREVPLRFHELPTSAIRVGYPHPPTPAEYEKAFLADLELMRKRWALKQAFLAANPQVKPRARRFRGIGACGHSVRTGRDCPSYGRVYDCDEPLSRSVYIDHYEVWKAWGAVDGAFVIGHNYDEPRPDEYAEHRLPPDIVAVHLPPRYSWYLPSTSNLTFVARPDVMETLNLKYHVPFYTPPRRRNGENGT